MNTNTVIAVRDLKKTYHQPVRAAGVRSAFASLFHRTMRDIPAVQSISFSVAKGEMVGFVGPNGAGKTTTLKILSGILYPDAGQVTVLGHTPWKRSNDFRKRISIVMGQRNQLWWDLPVIESLVLAKVIYRIPEAVFQQRLDHLTTLLDVKELLNVQVRKLSLGQRMRCELIAALLHEPEVLFLDEPTIGLDIISQQRIREFLKHYVHEKKMTVLLTSHNMDDIESLCKRVVIINEGAIVYDGVLEELRTAKTSAKHLTVTFAEPVPDTLRTRLQRIDSIEGATIQLTVPKEGVRNAVSVLMEQGTVVDMTIEEPRIETVIADIFSKK